MKKLSYPLLCKWFELENRLPSKVFSVSSPLLTLKAYTYSPLLFKHYFRRKLSKYQFTNVVVMGAHHRLACYRSKIINTRRDAVLDVIKQFGSNYGERLVFYFSLGKINRFVPELELTKHLRFLLNKSLNKQPLLKIKHKKQSREQIDNYYLVVKDFENNFDKWLQIQREKPFSQKVVCIQDIILQSIYLLQFSQDRKLIYQDCLLLTQIFKKFNFLQFFDNMHLNSKHSDIKHSERFIKLVKFQSSITEKYILFELKERQVDIVQLRIKYIVKAYENYFKGN